MKIQATCIALGCNLIEVLEVKQRWTLPAAAQQTNKQVQKWRMVETWCNDITSKILWIFQIFLCKRLGFVLDEEMFEIYT